MITLTPDQRRIVTQLYEWATGDARKTAYISVGGYAGTGKTTVLSAFRKKLHRSHKKLKIALVSYTGKASRVLLQYARERGAVYKHDFVGTIHSLIYSPIVNDRQEIVGWKRKDSIESNLIIIDEASMVDETIWRDLASYKVPLIAIGDHGQLPPVSGQFSLMQSPHLTLTRIHRQAAHNPIITLSQQARETGRLEPGTYAQEVAVYRRGTPESEERLGDALAGYRPDHLVLCGYNKTRKRLNEHIRSLFEFPYGQPVAGDRVVCLRNNHHKQIYNGMLGTIEAIEKESDSWYRARIQMDEELQVYEGLISVEQFAADTALNHTGQRYKTVAGDLFDFGYALTVHKAQGSQAHRVILLAERFARMTDDDWRRWLYTGVTRAQEELLVFI